MKRVRENEAKTFCLALTLSHPGKVEVLENGIIMIIIIIIIIIMIIILIIINLIYIAQFDTNGSSQRCT